VIAAIAPLISDRLTHFNCDRLHSGAGAAAWLSLLFHPRCLNLRNLLWSLPHARPRASRAISPCSTHRKHPPHPHPLHFRPSESSRIEASRIFALFLMRLCLHLSDHVRVSTSSAPPAFESLARHPPFRIPPSMRNARHADAAEIRMPPGPAALPVRWRLSESGGAQARIPLPDHPPGPPGPSPPPPRRQPSPTGAGQRRQRRWRRRGCHRGRPATAAVADGGPGRAL
jgi:hypothetical protein